MRNTTPAVCFQPACASPVVPAATAAVRKQAWWVFALALVLFSILTHHHVFQAGNDASRFAAIEALVDFHEAYIDHSQFRMTVDRVTIGGHDYSNKPPLLSLAGAALYAGIKTATGWSLASQSAAFYPLNYLALVLSRLFLGHYFGTMDFIAAFHLTIAVLGFRRLMRHFGLGEASSCFGAVAWAFCGFVMTAGDSWIQVLGYAAYFPWILLCSLRQIHGFDVRNYLALAALRILDLSLGYPPFNALEIASRRESAGSLVINVLYNPFFKAMVDGKEATLVETANHQMRLDLAGGRRRVVIRHVDPNFSTGLLVSAATLALMITAGCVYGIRHRRVSGLPLQNGRPEF